jgi:hypothetical protein
MADAIKNDPIITAYILKTANSPMYGLSRTVKILLQLFLYWGEKRYVHLRLLLPLTLLWKLIFPRMG